MESSSLSPLASVVPTAALLFPFPFPFSFSFVCLLHSPLFCNVNNEEWPASGFSTVLQSITVVLLFPFPFPFSFVWAALHYSAKWTVDVNNGEWPASSVSTFHCPSIHHCRAALPLPLPLCLGCSPLFCKVNSGECLHCLWSYQVWPKPKCGGPVRLSKIKKNPKNNSQILCFIKKISV